MGRVLDETSEFTVLLLLLRLGWLQSAGNIGGPLCHSGGLLASGGHITNFVPAR